TMNSNGNWSKPLAIGYPIDKNGEDIFYQVAADNRKVFQKQNYSAKQLKKLQADSIKEITDRENYIISFVNPKKIPLTLLKGKVTDKSGSLAGKAEITVTNNQTGKQEGIYYTDNKGQYSLILPAGQNNNITFEVPGRLFQSDNITVNTETDYYKKHHAVVMPLMEKNSKVLLNNVFFDSSGVTLTKTSEPELDRVLDLMRKNPEMKIELKDYVQCSKKICYSKRFARERAKSTATWLVQNGIDKERIKAKGFKRKKVSKKISKTHPSEASLNQLELTITELNK
ncbi:MAG: OmpA family protein, partial [Kaistella sp.]